MQTLKGRYGQVGTRFYLDLQLSLGPGEIITSCDFGHLDDGPWADQAQVLRKKLVNKRADEVLYSPPEDLFDLSQVFFYSLPLQLVKSLLRSYIEGPKIGNSVARPILCRCFGISVEEVQKLWREGKTLAEIQGEKPAGLGCGSCWDDLLALSFPANEDGEKGALKELTPQERFRLIERWEKEFKLSPFEMFLMMVDRLDQHFPDLQLHEVDWERVTFYGPRPASFSTEDEQRLRECLFTSPLSAARDWVFYWVTP